MGAFFLPLLAAGTAIQGVAAYKSGQAAAKGARQQAAAAKVEGDMARLRATQVAELSREQLLQTLGAIDTVRAGRGMSLNSATAQAIERQTVQNAYRNEGVQRLGELNRAQAADWQMQGYNRAARWALPLSMMNWAGQAATTWSSAIGGAATAGAGGGA